MLGFVEIIFSIIGFYGALSNNIVLMIIGLVSIIICDFIDIFISGHKPTTILLCIILGIGASIANKNPLYTFTIFLCGENLIMSIFTILLLIISFFKTPFSEKYNTNMHNNINHIKKNSNDWDDYLKNNFPQKGTATNLNDIKSNDDNISTTIKDIINNIERVSNIIVGKEVIDINLFLGLINPYTGEIIQTYDDIIEYLKLYKLDYNGINPYDYIKKAN